MEQEAQKQLEEERMMLNLAVLQRVARGISNQTDALFLAGELGLTTQFKQENHSG